uniref:Vitellogenin domain-containing protein n=1 Tax=Caenorhabditis tropicalis TaxID=1561998 RepID=A0A1I7TAZ9_9PELO
MRSIIFASLVALALASSPAFERAFEPKTDYHYKLDGLVLSGLPSDSSELSQSRISARARIQSEDDRHVLIQLVNIRMAASHLPESEQMPALNSMEQRELSDEYKQLLELPVRAQLRNGLISEIQFDKEDAEWSKNMKRAVLNMISFNPIAPRNEMETSESSYEDKESTEENTAFFTNEKTLEGDCQVAYTVVREQKKTIITKSINFDKCTERSETAYGLRFSSECPECDKETQVVRPQTVYTYVMENEQLKESEVRSLYTVNVNGQEVLKTETRSKLVLEENHSIKNHIKKVNGEKEDIIYSSRWEQLVEDFYKNGDKAEFDPFEKFPLDKKIQLIKTITEQVQEVENNMPETAHFLARLVRIFRTASSSQLKEIHETLYVKADKKIQTLIEHSLAIAGTKNTIQHLLSHIENEDIVPTEAAKLLKSIQETPFPSQSIAEALLKFAQSRVAKTNQVIRQSVWLATGSVVRGIVDIKNVRPLIREDKREMKNKFQRVFMKQFEEAETTYEKILALKTIGNAGLDISVNDLNEIIVDKRQPLPIRKEAIDALRLLKDTMPRKIQKVLLPIYKNRQYEPEIRMLALWRTMQTRPEEPLLVQVVSQMEKESNQQVAALTYQMIRQFAQSTNPCFQRLATDCSKVLSFTRYQPQEQMIASAYAQLPFFAQNAFSGAQFDFAAIFEKNSFLPKDLSASLDTVFGGNWNKYFAQVGFTQQHMDQYIYKILNKLQSLEKESTTVVRGRRIQTGIKLLKELAQKMNIQARPSSRNEKEAFAMLYFRYKDMDFAVLPIDSQLVDDLVEKFIRDGQINISEIRRALNQDKEFESHHAAFFYEAIRKMPTTLGLPLVISGRIPSVFSVEGQLTLELEGTELRLTVEARPSVASTHVYEMRMFTPLFEQGVKTLQSLRAFTPVKMQVVAGMKRNFEIVYKVIVPENQKSVLSLTTRPVVFLRYPGFSKFEHIEAEERTVVVPQWQQKTQEIEKVYNFLGLEVSTRGNVLNQHTLENWLLAEQDFEVSVENKNRPAEFTFRATVSPFEKTEIPQIKMDEIFEKEFELEQDNSENRREYFSKMIKNIQKEQGYKTLVTLKVEAPRDYNMNAEITTICDRQIRMCQWNVEARRSPISEETKEWTLRSKLIAIRPEMPSSLRQLREQPHREVQLSLTSTWGSQKKNEMNINAQLQQSKEQKKYERKMERETNGMPEYELLIKAARLNQINAVAEYKLTKETEQVIARYFDLLKAYNYWTVSSRPEDNEESRVVLQLTVEPLNRQYVNVTVQTPEQRVELVNSPIPRVFLPSIAQRSVKHQLTEASGSVCKVQKNQIRTFDDVLYKTPLTTCFSLLAKDCSEEPTFAVLSKKMTKNSEEMIMKVLRGEQEIVAQLQNNEIRVKVDGKKIESEDYSQYQIEQLGESAIVIELPEGEVRFDGYTIKTQLPTVSRQNTQLCGLCGNNDDESNNEFYSADNKETEDMEEFHRSYLLKNEECEAEEERLSEKKNYKKYERDEEESDESDESYENEPEYTKKSQRSQRKSQLVEKTQIKEFSHRICFSIEPVAECRRGYEIDQQQQRKIRFTCLPRHNRDASRLMKESRQQPLELNDYPVAFVEAVKVPTACVAY